MHPGGGTEWGPTAQRGGGARLVGQQHLGALLDRVIVRVEHHGQAEDQVIGQAHVVDHAVVLLRIQVAAAVSTTAAVRHHAHAYEYALSSTHLLGHEARQRREATVAQQLDIAGLPVGELNALVDARLRGSLVLSEQVNESSTVRHLVERVRAKSGEPHLSLSC